MNKQTYDKIIKELTEHRKGVSDQKRTDYTRSSNDVLANFKNVAESTGVTPLQVWLVYAQKQFDAIANYVKTEGESESEPIKERFGDLLNYAELGWGLVWEQQERQRLENTKPIEDSYPATPEEATKDKIPSFSKADKLLGKVLHDNYDLDGDQYEIRPELRDEIESYFNDIPSFCDTPNACYHDGCMCERTNKFVDDEKTEYNVENIWYNRLNESYFVTFHNGYGLSLHGKKIVSVETNELNSLYQLETKDKRYIVEDGKGTQDA